MVVVNSFDGRDVVSGIYYAAVSGEEIIFVTPAYSDAVLYGKIGNGNDILLIQPEDGKIIAGMKDELEVRGNTVETYISEDPYQANLELASRSGAEKFILVDPVYGYNTVSALAYAKENSMYLVFVDNNNMEDVVSFLAGKNPEDVLLYGYIDNEVKESLDENNVAYREINNGDKFDDNLEITELYFEKNPSKKQVILSDGNAFEDTIAAGDDPVILISPIIPSATYDYVEEKAMEGQIQVALVVDGEYAQTAYDMKESINEEAGSKVLSVMVKFGESTSMSGDSMAPVQFFQLPGPILGLRILGAEYNTVSNQLEVTYENTGNALEYVKSQIRVFVDGIFVGTVGDEEPFAIGRDAKRGIGYPIEIEEGEITVNITSFFGSSRKSTESGIQVVLDAGRVEFVDRSSLGITEFTEDRTTNDLYVTFSNTGDTPVYFTPDVTVEVQGMSTKIEDDNIYTLEFGESRIVKFPGIIKEESVVIAGADYGEREAFLENRIEEEYTPEQAFDTTILYIVIIALLVIIVAYLFWKKR